jgi:hypothetical protein
MYHSPVAPYSVSRRNYTRKGCTEVFVVRMHVGLGTVWVSLSSSEGEVLRLLCIWTLVCL